MNTVRANPIKFSNNSEYLALITNENLYLLETNSWNIVLSIDIFGKDLVVFSIAFNSKDDIIGIATNKGIYFYDIVKKVQIGSPIVFSGLVMNNLEFIENDSLFTTNLSGGIVFYAFYYNKQIILDSLNQNLKYKRIGDIVRTNAPILRVKFLPNNTLLSFEGSAKIANSPGTVRFWEYKTWKLLHTTPSDSKVSNSGISYCSIYYTPDFVKKLVYRDTITKSLDTFDIFGSPIVLTDFSKDDRFVLIISADYYYKSTEKIINIYDFDTKTLDTIRFQCSSNDIYVVFIDKSPIAYIGSGRNIWELGLERKSLKQIVQESENFSVSYLLLSPENLELLASFYDSKTKQSKLKIYSIRDRLFYDVPNTFNIPIHYMEYSPDNLFLVLISNGARNFFVLNANDFSVVSQIVEDQNLLITCARFSRDGKLFFEGTTSGHIIARSTVNWEIEKIIPAHKKKVTSIDISFDNKYLATGGEDENVYIWNLASNLELIQIDVSDSVFSVVPPKIFGKDVDMGQVLVGSVKDSLIINFVTNVGKFKTIVDTVFIRGGDAKKFKIISGFDGGEILPGGSLNVEFSFIPTIAGYFESAIVIVYNGDTVFQQIKGFGVVPSFSFRSSFLDFGRVTIGDTSIIFDTVLVENISDEPATVERVEIGGPDMEQYFILDGGGRFTLLPGEGRKFTVGYAPFYFGRSSSSLMVYYNGVGSPGVIQLFGEGVGGRFVIPDDSGYVGERKLIKIQLDKVKIKGLAKEEKRY
ncbi:MAG: hypothetical protein N2560_00070 [Ignavibacteria bacterium]|nr:hypothetical protein [Ignavibacteria bacterium]